MKVNDPTDLWIIIERTGRNDQVGALVLQYRDVGTADFSDCPDAAG